ncbi:MAG: RNA polymerase subunit sigma-70 [Opitutus sp.]|nr:RNA polymerase subunit sigma-70 [Opitutus sp.]
MIHDPKQVLTELLVLQARQGDEGAFRQLFELWHGDLRRLTLARVEQPAAADEVVNTVWLAIARGLGGLDDPACFPRWAFRIVERRSADWVRRRVSERRRESIAQASVELLVPTTESGSTEPDDELLALRSAIAELPKEQRELLQLFYEFGRSVAEMAEILDVPVGTVKSRLYSVRETLKRKLERKSP